MEALQSITITFINGDSFFEVVPVDEAATKTLTAERSHDFVVVLIKVSGKNSVCYSFPTRNIITIRAVAA